ncbi:uncharacterized protein DS421_9g279430 [Arachis hypogaea]|nr:uncharacterized protein DS421_9g279430 [Arachis hypogaea]
MYSCLFTELGIRLPFTDFECGVLYWLNCAPTQLHPNSWGFVRAFQLLMDVLELPPSLRLFFSLFQAKGVGRGLWVNLSSYPCRSIFALYKSFFKDFKTIFVKVRTAEEDFPFYLNEYLEERFPLSWCPEPVQVLDVDDRVSNYDIFMEFLFEMLSSKDLLSIAELLKCDTDRQTVLDYIAPTITTAGLKSFFSQQKKNEKEGSTTNIEKDVGAAPVQSELNPTLQMVEFAYESQKRLHGYVEDEHAKSLWAKLFPCMTLADELCCFPEDMKTINEVGRVGTSRLLQVIGTRIVAIGRTQELALEKEEKKALSVAELSAVVQEKEKVIVERSSSLKQKEMELTEEKQLQLSSVEQAKTKKSENDQLVASVKVLLCPRL